MPSFSEVTRTAGKQRVVERHPYTGSGIDALAIQVGAILKVEQEAQRIVLDVTKSYIHVEKFVKGVPNPDELQETYNNVLTSNFMQEYSPEKKLSPHEYLYNLFRLVTDEELEVMLVFVGNMVTLDKWVSISKKNPRLMGVPVKRLKNIPDDVIVVCGAEWRDAEPEDIRFTVKGVMT